jgi:microcompartment protein CcmK/EutM
MPAAAHVAARAGTAILDVLTARERSAESEHGGEPQARRRWTENMRVAEVIGTITLSRRLDEIDASRLLIVQPLDEAALRDGGPGTAEPVVVYDRLHPGVGARVAISEGREAAMPFYPRRAPIDAYCAAVLDQVHVDSHTQE